MIHQMGSMNGMEHSLTETSHQPIHAHRNQTTTLNTIPSTKTEIASKLIIPNKNYQTVSGSYAGIELYRKTEVVLWKYLADF